MKTAIFLIALFCLVVPVRAQEIQPGTRPDKTQRELLKRGYGMFIHYGMNRQRLVRRSRTGLNLSPNATGLRPMGTYRPGGRFPICRIGDQAPRRFLLMGQ